MIVTPESIHFSSPKGFLVLDGVNGAGKTTLLKKIEAYLSFKGTNFTSTREPGATPVGKELRSILLEGKAGEVSPVAEILLFAGDRAEHVDKVIAPALAKKELVLCDRYVYSTLAFQGYGRELSLEDIKTVNNIAARGYLPDFVILLDLSPEEGLKRTAKRDEVGGKDSFEAEELSFHTRLRNGFLKIADEAQEPFLKIDASESPEQIFSTVMPVIEKWRTSLASSH